MIFENYTYMNRKSYFLRMILGLSAVYQKRIIQPFFKRTLFMRLGWGALGQLLGLSTSYFLKCQAKLLKFIGSGLLCAVLYKMFTFKVKLICVLSLIF